MKTFFGPGGCFQAHDTDFSFRPGQLQMSEAVETAINEKHHLAVEGGTGVGKSLAYLVPALKAAWDDQKRVIVSTWSISLQQQLVEKDLPWLEEQLGRPISWVLAKGRNNYVSKRRLRIWLESMPTLFEDEPDAQKMVDWVEGTRDGSLSDWPGLMDADIWTEVVSDRDNCLGRRCETYESCFFYEARRELEAADLIIVNHSLFFSHLALGVEGFLPPADVLIFDEAHHLEKVAGEHLGFRLTEGDLYRLCDRLSGRSGRRGLLVRNGIMGHELVDEVRQKTKRFFRDLQRVRGDKHSQRVLRPLEIPNFLGSALGGLSDFLREASEKVPDDAAREFKSTQKKIRGIQVALDNFLNVSNEDFVYWIEGSHRIQIVSAPIDVSKHLRESLFSNKEVPCILTSATLSQADSFDYFCERVGFEGESLIVSTPFDLEKQMDLIFDYRLGDPNQKAYLETLTAVIQEHVQEAPSGGIFVLLTSRRVLNSVAEALKPWIEEQGRPLLVQGQDGPDRKLIEQFKSSGKAVLLGTDRFWTGIDVPGQALETVIIVKLPFQYPDHPLHQARCEFIEQKGGSSFRDFILPEAILKLRQGLGRLIRTQGDRGRVVMLDGRILSKSYGTLIRKSLPHRGRIWQPESKFKDDSFGEI